MIIEDLSKDGKWIWITKSEIFNCVSLALNEYDSCNAIMLGKAEVQELIDQLEELKKNIL
tara:strand:+ start:67 stop:246 length:180 start_codon:yes stop_codon:yes gene_type:complete